VSKGQFSLSCPFLQKRLNMTQFFGSVTGKLIYSQLEEKPSYQILGECLGDSIICYFPPNFPCVSKALGKRISVYGQYCERENGSKISIKVERLEIMPLEDELPTIEDMIGIL
jgi:hypothetical protein